MLHLRVISGPSKGRIVSLDHANLPITIGRDPENRIALDHTAVSRFHCEISAANGTYYVADKGSTNGTYLNGLKIEREKISPGDELIIANVGIIVEASRAPLDLAHMPMQFTVSVDAQPKADNALTYSSSAEAMGVDAFLGDHIDQNNTHALQVLYKADRKLRNIEDRGQMLDGILELIMQNVSATRGYIFMIQRDTGNLELHARSPKEDLENDGEVVVSQTILQTAVRQQSSIISSDALVDERFQHSRSIVDNKVRSAMCAPMINRGKALGIIYVDSPQQNAFDRQGLALLSAIALKASVAVDNSGLYDDLRSLFYNTVETLVRTIQAKDQYTSGHSVRVSRYSLLIADKLGLSNKERHQLYLAAMLHDIGKIGVPDDLLNRPGKLTEEEMERVRNHVQLGASMIEMLGEMHPIVPLIRHHHEAWDGSGYPDGLRGEEIPLISRIVAAADMYDAMTSDRAYRKARTHQEAVAEVERVRGVKLDPRVADAFLTVLAELAPDSRELHATTT